jgi:hypothetical protein
MNSKTANGLLIREDILMSAEKPVRGKKASTYFYKE